MRERIADQEQRRRAILPDRSFIVQAPAGSGKTELLIQRYLALLACVDDPEEIVAITFTRKAATEMRGRIIGALDRAREGRAPEDDAAAVTRDLADRVLQRDASQRWELGENPGRLRVQTVDSLCGHLTRQLPLLSRFGAQPESVEDASDAYREAAAAALAHLDSGDEWSDSIAVLLGHLDNDLPRARGLIADMLERRDQWLEHVLDPRRDHLEAGLRHLVESTLRTARRSIPEQQREELFALLDFASTNLAAAEGDSPIASCSGLEEMPGPNAENRERWHGIADLLLTRDGNWRRRPDAGIGFPPASSGKAQAEASKAMKHRYSELLSRLAGYEGLRRIFDDVRHLPEAQYTDHEWPVVEALCRVLLLADAELSVVFAERGQIDFAGVTRAAITALGGDDDPTDLALYLDYQIRHILVDEFQDISVNQYQVLCRLTAGWTVNDGRTLFLVGDPMQSIYRFREADVGLFLETWEQARLGQVPLTPLSITVNLRSVPGIVEWVNATFAVLMPAVADSARGAVPHVPAQAYHSSLEADPVRVHPFLGDDSAEADRVLQIIEAAQQSDPDGSIAILVRNRSSLPAILDRLKRAARRFRAVEIEGLGHRPAIQDLLALTRALHHFGDRIAWLAVLRAPWCGLDVSDLTRLAAEGGDATVWECMADVRRTAALSEQGRVRVQHIREELEAIFSQRRRRRLRRWVESAWLRLGGPATLGERSDLINAATFLDLLDEFDVGGDLVDLDRFAGKVQELFAAPDTEADGRLQILTIHKSKGLEFDTVIVPGLGRGPRRDDPRLLLWAARADAAGHRDLLLAPGRSPTSEEAPIYDCLRRLDHERQEYEEGRLIYVAATRARSRLHLVGSAGYTATGEGTAVPAPRSGSLLAQLWPVLEPDFVQARAVGSGPDAALPAERPARVIQRLPAGWRAPQAAPSSAPAPDALIFEPLPVDGTIEFEWAGETIMHIGTLVHRYLERIAEEGVSAWNEERLIRERGRMNAQLVGLGVPGRELPGAAMQVEEALLNLLRDERGAWLFDDIHVDRRSEFGITGLHEGRLISVKIDRTFVEAGGVRWIVDYKTSRHQGRDVSAFLDREQERYAPKMQTYAALLSRLDPRPIRLGLYFPLLKGWREWAVEA